MCTKEFGVTAFILATCFHSCASTLLTDKPRFTINAEKNKAFHGSFSIGTFDINGGNIAECLEHCLQDCRCQSFQICQNTKCQLCSTHKKENSSLLHEEEDCVYATYEMRELTQQNLEGQCSSMSCSMNDHCCQQLGICSGKKICKPINSAQQPWKRFTCECKEGYHGDDCDQPIRSCKGYANVQQESGRYKLLDSHGSLYEAYCYFDNEGAWTLVQSFSLANGSATTEFTEFRKPLSQNYPVGEKDLAWSGYRVSKSRMQSIEEGAKLLGFTCNYPKYKNIQQSSDNLQIRLEDVGEDVIELNGRSRVHVQRGKIGGMVLGVFCNLEVYQHYSMTLHASGYFYTCDIQPSSDSSSCGDRSFYSVFGNYDATHACFDKRHGCVLSSTSTTQLWFVH